MAITHYLPADTTEAQVFQALIDDVATDLTGSTVAMEATDVHGNAVTITGTVGWSEVTTGKWSYTPDGQLTKALSPYRVRATITDGGGAIAKSPNQNSADTWWVVDP